VREGEDQCISDVKPCLDFNGKSCFYISKCVIRFTLFDSFRSGRFFLVERYLLAATGVLSVFFVRSSLLGRRNRFLPSSLYS
jgi:hypothetical protein